ncbi:DUF4097 family beta strand repeat-containing protein [Vagococcus acidifermentans]|nr:DUF4097 family beta strand repeat-containing protein [Vagococcus acidifermentans]
MKRRTLVILGTAVLLILTGAVGSGYYYFQLEKERAARTIYETYPSEKADTLNLTVDGAAHVDIRVSDDDDIHLTQEGALVEQNDFKREVKTKNNETNVKITYSEPASQTKKFFHNFNQFTDETIQLRVPKSYQKIAVKGANVSVSLNTITAKSIDIDSENGSASLFDITADELKFASHSGDIRIDDVFLEKDALLETRSGSINVEGFVFNTAQFVSSSGYLSLYELKTQAATDDKKAAEQITIKTSSGDMSLDTVQANTLIENGSGEIDIRNIKGKLTAKNDHGGISIESAQLTADASLTTKNGDIYISLSEDGWKKSQFSGETKLGDIYLDDEPQRNPYKKSASGPSISATSNTGDITLYTYRFEDYED